jgi:hypothetical protein
MVDITFMQVILVAMQMSAPFIASVALLIAAVGYYKKVTK